MNERCYVCLNATSEPTIMLAHIGSYGVDNDEIVWSDNGTNGDPAIVKVCPACAQQARLASLIPARKVRA